MRKLFAFFGKNKDGAEGIKKARTQTGAVFPVLLDPGAVETALYSRGGSFTTYVIGKEGKIDAVLDGVKVNRPTADEILSEL